MIYMIGCLVAVVVCLAAVYNDWKSRDVTRGMAAIFIACVLTSWFCVLLMIAIAIDESDWGQEIVLKRKEENDGKDDEKA